MGDILKIMLELINEVCWTNPGETAVVFRASKYINAGKSLL